MTFSGTDKAVTENNHHNFQEVFDKSSSDALVELTTSGLVGTLGVNSFITA